MNMEYNYLVKRVTAISENYMIAFATTGHILKYVKAQRNQFSDGL